MSGYYTKAIKRKSSPTKKVILFVILISVFVLSIRSWLENAVRPSDEDKQKEQIISDQKSANKIVQNKPKTELKITSENDDPQNIVIESDSVAENNASSIKITNNKSKYSNHKVRATKRYSELSIESAIRKKELLPPEKISLDSPTFIEFTKKTFSQFQPDSKKEQRITKSHKIRRKSNKKIDKKLTIILEEKTFAEKGLDKKKNTKPQKVQPVQPNKPTAISKNELKQIQNAQIRSIIAGAEKKLFNEDDNIKK